MTSSEFMAEITLIPIDELLTIPDMKAMSAYALYQRFRSRIPGALKV
jgi:hypothetical protein